MSRKAFPVYNQRTEHHGLGCSVRRCSEVVPAERRTILKLWACAAGAYRAFWWLYRD